MVLAVRETTRKRIYRKFEEIFHEIEPNLQKDPYGQGGRFTAGKTASEPGVSRQNCPDKPCMTYSYSSGPRRHRDIRSHMIRFQSMIHHLKLRCLLQEP